MPAEGRLRRLLVAQVEVQLALRLRRLCRPDRPHKPPEHHSLQESLRSAGLWSVYPSSRSVLDSASGAVMKGS